MSSLDARSADWRSHLRQSLIVLPIGLVLVAGGCHQPKAAIADPQQARNVLQQTLDAWKKGDSVESLQSLSPPIHVNDPDWRSNKPLVEYAIREGESIGNSWSCGVELTVKDREGKTTKQLANYTVDTSPKLVVVRDVVE